MKKLLILLLSAMVVMGMPLQARTFEEGVDYSLISLESPNVKPGEPIEVVEFFMYTCPHCYDFEPIVKAWLSNKPEDIRFERIPAMFGGAANLHAKVYYALQAIGELERIHEHFFAEIHERKNRLENRQAILDFMQTQQVDVKKFESAMDSFAVAVKTNRAASLMRRYAIRAVPKMVVDGRYRFERGAKQVEMPMLVDFLAEQVRQERSQENP